MCPVAQSPVVLHHHVIITAADRVAMVVLPHVTLWHTAAHQVVIAAA